MAKRITVQLTANFERNLEEIERFLAEAGAPHAYDALLDCRRAFKSTQRCALNFTQGL